MNYELAKKLKEAGFPKSEHWFLSDPTKDTDGGFLPHMSELNYYPKLSDLIKACGDNFFRVTKLLSREWTCENVDTYASNLMTPGNIIVWGKTPEEAVANLWLELNKKL